MTRSSCLCGANIIEFTDAPVLKFKCHCMDERKLTGAAPFSLNWLVPDDTLKVLKGKLSEATITVNSGNSMTNHCCGTCGSLLYRVSSGYPGKLAVKVGCVDDEDVVANYVPDIEIFTRNRVSWVPAVEGATQEWADFGSGPTAA